MAESSLTKLKSLSTALNSVGQKTPGSGLMVNHSQFGKKVELRLYTDGRVEGNLDKDRIFTFPVNPEDFTLNRNERVQVVQTLGEPFIDEFGKGIPTLTIRGTTGWRVRPSIENIDGHEAFKRLHRNFIDKYFSERAAKTDSIQNPNDINLVIINHVDDLSYKVAPQNFRLLRNRNKPLLYQYEITFWVLQDLNDINGKGALELPFKPKSRNWLSALTDRIAPLVNRLEVYAAPVCHKVAGFISNVTAVLENAKSGVGDIANFIYGVSSSVQLVLDATRDTQKFINNLPLDGILAINDLTSVLSEFNCYLQNGLTESWLPDFSGIEGVTDCATTHGIKSGEIADSTGNAVEWVVNLREAAKRNGSTAMIGIRHDDAALANMFEEPNTAIIIDAGLNDKLSTLNQISKGPAAAATSISDIYGAIGDTLDCLDISADRLPANDTINDNLKKITQLKIVTVREGDTLQKIAYREYGDVSRWTEIAAANDIVIESAAELLAPLTTYPVQTDLYRGTQEMDIGIIVPADYAEPGCILTIKDAKGAWQRMRVQSVSGSKINLFETFSQNFTAPITVIRMINLADFGVMDSQTVLTDNFMVGQNQMALTEVKNIYPGYTLYLSGNNEARKYTVEKVNYLEKLVSVKEPSIGFPAGAKVGIYNTETSQTHLTPGIELKIPITSGDQGNLSQTAGAIYGCDIETDASGVLIIKNGDFATISGIANLKQAIEHRITSKYESLIVHPQYGCGLLAILGSKNTPAIRTLARATLVDALNREPRLEHIAQLTEFSVGDAIKFTIEVESVDSNTPTDLNFVIGGNN